MKATITSIKLRGPFKIFALSSNALQIIRQLKATNCKEFKKKGFWTTHYTMTLWSSEEELKNFARSGAHLKAMQLSKALAKEIRTVTIETDSLPQWAEAKEFLKKGNVIKY